MNRTTKIILLSPLFLAAFAGFVALGGEIVKLLWNWLLPALFAWPHITFWQALALLALCRILFGGLGMHGRGPRGNIRRRMGERWERMTPEERERCRQRFQRFWGGAPPAQPGPSGSSVTET